MLNVKIEPISSHSSCKNSHAPSKDKSTRERVMASTMSVDEYFDELIDKVREDYANL